MVCIRCKMVVKNELTKLGLEYRFVELGEADIIEQITEEKQELLRAGLLRSGLELMDDQKSLNIKKLKNIIIALVHYSEEPLPVNLSVHLSQLLKQPYPHLAHLFAEVTGSTIEKYYISHKIERVKELLVYDEMNLTDIAFQMHYSSVAHLSAQFKKITGLTPTHFKELSKKRKEKKENL